MAITLKTHKMLWGRSGNKCAFPDCGKDLVTDETETDDASIIGDEAHIVAKERLGPRGISNLSIEDRDKYDNLILLCKVHHKIIDDQPSTYSIEKLKDIKKQHIDRIEGRPDYDQSKQHDDEIYASYVEKWAGLVNLDEWKGWTFSVLSPRPEIEASQYNKLREAKEFIFSRIWPKRYPTLEIAFINFMYVLNDFLDVLDKHLSKQHSPEFNYYVTKDFCSDDVYNPEGYDKLLVKYNYHVDLVHDLTLELTRAANYLCYQIRKCLLRSFRLNEGVLLVESGPYSDLNYRIHRVEYQLDEITVTDWPYPGLKEFMKIRTSRDRHFGEGYSIDYFWPPVL